MTESKEFLEVILNKKSKENNIVKILNTEIKSATEKGDNYGGILNKVSMEVLLKNGKTRKKNVMIKEKPTTKCRKYLIERMGIFKKEITMYNDVLPYMEDILNEFGDHSEVMWPKCLHTIPYNTLILNDLTDDGYKMSDRRQGLDLEHCLLVVRSLAKFHATSVILKERGLLCLELFTEHMMKDKDLQKMNEPFQKQIMDKLINVVNTWGPQWKPVAEKINNITPNLNEILCNLLEYNETQFNVLCHGDCWVNNMLFKYGLDNETPISLKFIDFQVSFYNSPAFDLKYFLNASPNMEVRKNSIQKLLNAYHTALLKQLKLYSYKGTIPTLDWLMEEMNRVEVYGLLTAGIILPIVLIENTKEIPDMEAVMENFLESGGIDDSMWQEFSNPPPMFSECIKEILTASVKNKSL